jgi:agmatinase
MLTRKMNSNLIEPPRLSPQTFLNFPTVSSVDEFDGDIAILGIPFGMPYETQAMANDQSRAPDALRQYANQADILYTRNHYDWDLRGPLLDNREIKVVDCGNVTTDKSDHKAHYVRAE